MTPTQRIAGAPISRGVSEVPGWGHQMRCERVLAEMRELGLAATEAGPDGFLPDDTGRVVVGGGDPVAIAEQAGERVAHLHRVGAAGYDGWYVFEQDTKLPAEPDAGAGPCEDVARSLEFLQAAVTAAAR
jgi:hypothetical protein